MDWQRVDNIVTTHLGSALAVVLVGVTAFILGSQYQPSNETVTSTNSLPEEGSSLVISELKNQLINPVAPTSETTAPDASQPVGSVNINSASQAELETLPGIGPSKAKAIIDYRLKNGPFIRIEDLDKVSGIGPKTLETLRPLVSL